MNAKITRMPAEWAQHEGTWISWPHNVQTWPGLLPEAEAAVAAIVAAIAPGEPVHINVLDAQHRAHVWKQIRTMVPGEQVIFHEIATNDAWVRDHGAIFVIAESGERIALDFDFNAWGGKYPPWDLDQAVARQMAAALGATLVHPGMVLEGGAIEVNGAGCMLTTKQCLLNPNRNPALGRSDIEERLAMLFGCGQIVWLDGGIAGDDTDGHIDNIARFVDESTVVVAVEHTGADVNHAVTQKNLRHLRTLSPAGRAVRVLELPMPRPLFAGECRLPASYANFYIANNVVLLPVFDDPADQAAVELLSSCFASRSVETIDSRALIHGLGGIHCLTQQIPAVSRQL